MPPPRRGARRRTAAAAAKSPRASRRLSVRRGEPFKRESRGGGGAAAAGDDDGLPLDDESLLLVFSALAATVADLVRCAATCRRWRRLVSADAAFICLRAPPRLADPFVRSLALGFLHWRTDAAAAAPPRFVPLSPAGARLQPSLAALVGGASRVVASRNGRLVLDLRRRASSRATHAVWLGVCNPVTAGCGSVDVLPPLRGKDSPTGPYACTVITVAEEHGGEDRRASHHASYRVLLLYNRRSFTALPAPVLLLRRGQLGAGNRGDRRQDRQEPARRRTARRRRTPRGCVLAPPRRGSAARLSTAAAAAKSASG